MLDLSQITTAAQFLKTGMACGTNADYFWAVVDPVRHPLFVWKKQGRYSKTAKKLNAAIFTNGPLIGKRLLGLKLARKSVVAIFLCCMIIGAAIGFDIGGYLDIPLGVVTGIALAWIAAFTRWIPCGGIHGNQIDDWRNFDNEGKQWAWFGRFGENFDTYQIGHGDLPKTIHEGMGGLVPLVSNHHPAQGDEYHWNKPGIVGWGLVPDHRTIVVIGSQRHNCHFVAALFINLGARDAVATDLRGCSMMGTGRTFMIAPLSWYREAMQSYGFYCR